MKSDQDRPEKFDEEIGAALKTLSEIAPPAEMVSRVHQRVDAAAMSQRTTSGRALLIPAAGIAMAVLVLFAIFTPIHRTRENQAAAVETAKVVAIAPLTRVTGMPPSATVEVDIPQERKRSAQQVAERQSRQKREHLRATNLLSYPLTRQEKLLLQFAATAKPEDLRDLNPEYQAEVDAQQDAEFAAYLKSGSGSSTKETAN